MGASWGDPDPATQLEKLAAELDGGSYSVALVTGKGTRPHLHVTNRHARQLTENIYSDGRAYWWGWGEAIAPVADVAAAATVVARVLRALDTGR